LSARATRNLGIARKLGIMAAQDRSEESNFK